MNSITAALLLITFMGNSALTVFSIKRKDNSRSAYFALFTLAAAMYSLGYMLLELSESYDAVINALRVANLGIPLIGPGFSLIVLSLFRPRLIKWWMAPGLLIYGAVMFMFAMFADVSGIYYSSVETGNLAKIAGSSGAYVIKSGIIYWIQRGFGLACMCATHFVFLQYFINGNKKFRTRTRYILIGFSLAVAANITLIIIAVAFPLRHIFVITPFIFTILFMPFFINLAKHQPLNTAAIASNTAIEIMNDAIIITDDDWGFLSCNASAKLLFPSLSSYEENEPIINIKDWPDELAFITEDFAAADCEKVFTRTDETGKIITYKATINKINKSEGCITGWYIVIRDATDVTNLVNQLEGLATTDPLTGVANRRYFLERVHRELIMAERLNLSNALIMYDIDDFKKVNDTYGHVAGDTVLCAVVDTIKRQLRSYDILGRYGGEEFVIFTTATEEDMIYKFAMRLCKAIEKTPITYEDITISVTASFGAVQIYPGDTFEDAMLAVDSAMYKAKHNGKNQVMIGVIPRARDIKYYSDDINININGNGGGYPEI